MTKATTTILSVRVSGDERALLESAAEQSRTSLSEFIRRKSVEAAEVDVLHRSTVSIPVKDWEQLEAWLSKPARPISALKKLLASKPTWEK